MSDVYWNHSNQVIFITRGIRPDPHGGPADFEERMIICPGQGIDLSILGLKNEKPEQSEKAK